MQRSSTLSINLDLIQNNLLQYIKVCKHVMVMVKGEGYGTDAVILSKFIQNLALSNIPFLGVSHVWEALRLRKSGIQMPIFVISTPPHHAKSIAEYDLTAAISSLDEAGALIQAAKKHKKRIPVHLFLNTGMNRFGISPEKALSLYQMIQNSESLLFEGVLTHFAAAATPKFDLFTQQQISLFKEFTQTLASAPRWIHAAGSAGAARFLLPFCNLARIGLGMFGYGPCPKKTRPALALTTTLNTLTDCKKGESVGYDRTFTIQSDRGRIGVLAFGYYDGFHRSSSGKGFVLIRGKKAPMIGLICMDFMMIDLTLIPEARIGDSVILFDQTLPLEKVAEWTDTNMREVLVRLGPRVKRQWIMNPKPQAVNDKPDSERLPNSILTFKKNSATR